MSSTYVTVAIPYVNAVPHLGYAYELVEADIFARSRRLAGSHVRFVGGTDDHSLKNVLAAESVGLPVQTLVDAHAARFQGLAEPLGISFDDFVRTSTDPRHRPAVERLWRACADAGDLYRSAYEAEYCVGCEQFYTAAELVEGCCRDHGTPTERIAEENWFFRLSAYQDHLDDLISSDALQIRPEPFRNEVLAFVRSGLADISVSRSTGRARGWGIGVPDDPTQVVYVWFDALTNYLSGLDFGDPDSHQYHRWWLDSGERVHVIGKNILRFHAVYWPAFLASAGQPPPTRIQVHPYLTVYGTKISKSSGKTVDPVALVEAYGTDALRWWFARDVGQVADTDFALGRFVARVNEDLANGLGNVTNRITTLVHRYRPGWVPTETEPVEAAKGLEAEVAEALAQFDLRTGCQLIVDAVTALNRDLEVTEPWKLAKAEVAGDPTSRDRLDLVLARQLATARLVAIAARPIVPELSARLLDRLDTTSARSDVAPSPLVHRLESP